MFGVIRTHCIANDKFQIPHCVTNDMNCFYDGVPSLRCAAFGMTRRSEASFFPFPEK